MHEIDSLGYLFLTEKGVVHAPALMGMRGGSLVLDVKKYFPHSYNIYFIVSNC